MAVYDKPIANLMLNSKKLQALGSWTRQECPFSPLLFNIGAEVPVRPMSKKRKKKKKDNKVAKLFTDDMILYTENPKDTTKKLLELNVFDKVAT